LQDDAVETVFQNRGRRTCGALGFCPGDSCEDVNASPKELTQVITGGLSAVLARLWLSSIGYLWGYGLSAILALYTVIGGSIALVGVFVERASSA
jgi:hypothetical protein